MWEKISDKLVALATTTFDKSVVVAVEINGVIWSNSSGELSNIRVVTALVRAPLMIPLWPINKDWSIFQICSQVTSSVLELQNDVMTSEFNNARYNDDSALLEAAVSQGFSQTDLDSHNSALLSTAAQL